MDLNTLAPPAGSPVLTPTPTPSEPKKRHVVRWVILGVVALGLLAAIFGGGSTPASQTTATPAPPAVSAPAAPVAPAPAKAAPKPAKANSMLCAIVKDLPIDTYSRAGALSAAKGAVLESDPQAVRDAAVAFKVDIAGGEEGQAAANQAFVDVLRASC